MVLKGRVRHELACASCGAPLKNMKMLRKDHDRARKPEFTGRAGSTHHPGHKKLKSSQKTRRPRAAKRAHRKGLMHQFFDEAFDIIEDIFD